VEGGNQLETKIQLDVREAIIGPHRLPGTLTVPPDARGVVAFAHGSGSSRLSPRNQTVAQTLQEVGLATLLFDLLEEEEAEDRRKVFDIELLAQRLQEAADWIHGCEKTRGLRLGYFGASTGAAAALVAAARQPRKVSAVVSRGGRPDLAKTYLSRVQAPTLLVVGGEDEPVISLNQLVFDQLRCEKRLEIIPRATHLFPEPGVLEKVARLAADWFQEHLAGAGATASRGNG
jgi:putative phosphoribosyl transferase